MTPLHWAVEQEHKDVIHILLEHGADPNASSKFDKTPIGLAFEHNRLDLVAILQQDRDILHMQQEQQQQQQQQIEINSPEINEASHSLMQIEDEQEQQPIHQQKRKITQGKNF